jgi:mRNA-degrading endonuclease RelE of RelBE toxin-antitoxin system
MPAAIVSAVYELTDNPRPTGSTQLGGSGTYRRLLLGYYRVLYSVTDDPPQIKIFLVGRCGRGASNNSVGDRSAQYRTILSSMYSDLVIP